MILAKMAFVTLLFSVSSLLYAADGAERSIQRNEQFRADQGRVDRDRAYHRALTEKENTKLDKKTDN
jgi:hypothetical protein